MKTNEIIQGDCLEVLKTLPDKSVDLIVTDPPYGINYQSAWRIDTERFDKIANDDKILVEWLSESYRLMKDSGAIYVFSRIDVYPQWRQAITDAGFREKSVIVWDRVIHGLGDLEGAYAPQYDIIIFAVKGKHKLRGNRPKNIIRCKREDLDKMIHPTMKPVKLLEQLIKNSSDEGDVVLDPFVGSGSTCVAAIRTGRKWIGIELNEKYAKAAKDRVAEVVGQDSLKSFMSA